MKSLQNQYNLIKEGKGSKDVFIKSAKTQFPDIPNYYGFNETVNELKYRNILNEGMLGIVSAQPTVPDWFKLFNESVNEAKSDISIDKIKKQLDDLGVKYEMSKTDKVKPFKVIYKPINKSDKFYDKFDDIIDLANLKSVVKSSINEAKAEENKPTKEVVDMEIRGFDYKDKKNIDNVYGEQFLKGFYTEMQDPKNEEKTVEELKSIVAKNLAKDQLHYVKDGQFGIKGVGYTTEHPGLGTPKEAKGKYKSSGYGNLNESLAKLKFSDFKEGDTIVNKFSGTQYTVIKVGERTLIIQQGDDGDETEIASLNNYEKFPPSVNEYGEDEFDRSPQMYSGGKSSREGRSDFDGTGLIVVGRTQLDNNSIADMVDETDYYGVQNTREGYWFFPESEETLDSLEMELEQEFSKRGINARFEGQLNESLKNKQYYKNIAYLDKRGLAKKQFSDEDIQTAKKMLSNGEFNLNENQIRKFIRLIIKEELNKI